MLRQWNLRFVSVNGSPLFLPYEYYNNVFKIPESKNIVPWHGGWGQWVKALKVFMEDAKESFEI